MSQESAIWQDLLIYIKNNIPEVEFQTWFRQTAPLGIENGTFMIAVPNSFVRDWFKNHYAEVIEEGLKVLGADYPKVGFEISSFQAEQPELFDTSTENNDNGIDKLMANTIASPSPIANPTANLTASPTASPTASSAANSITNSPLTSTPHHPRPRLNPKYTFANFIVGPNNNLSHAAARATVKSPGKSYNPLFIYGDAGLGKTHLMHAVGQAALERFPNLVVEYVSTETFTNELITAIRQDKMVQFRHSYRSIDLLLIDDVQFIEGKERTQEEFFHTFNDLHQAGKQIILSSDRPPKDISKLEGRLRNRFEWGLITDIQTPDFETRIAILKMNAEYRKVAVNNEVIEYIAHNVTNNIRELEGALIRVIVYTSMNDLPLNRQNAAKALFDVFMPADLDLSMDVILRACSEHFDVSIHDVLSKGRRAELVNVRQIAMYLIRELTDHSFPEIGSFFANRDHTTVMHAVNKVDKTLKEDTDLMQHIREIKNKLI